MATANPERRDPGALSIRQWLQELTVGQVAGVIATLAGLVTLSFQAGRLWESYAHREVAADERRLLSEAKAIATQASSRAAAAESENAANQRKLADALAALSQSRKELEQLRNRPADAKTAGQSTSKGDSPNLTQTPRPETGRGANTSLPDQRSSAQTQPRTWQEYEGFKYLVGTWRGKVVAGPSVEMIVQFPTGDDVFASIALVGTTCTLSAKIIRATQMFAASQFYFKPTTISAGCPDVDYIKATPVLDSMQWELAVQNGRPLLAALARKI